MLEFAEISFFRFIRADHGDVFPSKSGLEQSLHGLSRVVDRVENTNFERPILYVIYLPRLPSLHLFV